MSDPSTSTSASHPVTTHLRQAAEHIRLANHATFGDHREVTDLYDTLGALSTLMDRLPQLVTHLASMLNNADAALYTVTHFSESGTPAETLNRAALNLVYALNDLTHARHCIQQAWADSGRLRICDLDTQHLD